MQYHNSMKNIIKEPNYSILFVLASFILTLSIYSAAIKKENVLREKMWHLSEENEIIHTYVENLDIYNSIEEAVQARDRMYEHLQFLDE